ncbi:hypothetical protein CDAR_526041 [Caerostris darwini]|uniref:Uncharacterized protein n=1 Tax=Caerostris darwini TaxID=1538125 RepID=A0AAV4Q5C2_9ARAC|nr:hypothetical protein CDAR_526041 [Caerostris darwini]
MEESKKSLMCIWRWYGVVIRLNGILGCFDAGGGLPFQPMPPSESQFRNVTPHVQRLLPHRFTVTVTDNLRGVNCEHQTAFAKWPDEYELAMIRRNFIGKT